MVQLLYVIASLHSLLCPFTKVEESFNIQATHDILYHRNNLSQYDHNEFPGVVPRSFIGPLILSIASAPTVTFFNLAELNKFWSQYVIRLALGLCVITAWIQLKNTLRKLYGNTYAWWYTLITVTQYHFMFYMTRPLPNIMALPLVLLAFNGWLSNKHKQFIISAGASIIIFRSELAILFGLFLIMDLYFKKIDIVQLLRLAIPAGIGLVALTVLVDSIFWSRLIWPEAEVFWYNTVLNKSSNWGTSPFLWYFYSALPRGLGPSLVLIPVGIYLDKRMVQVVAPAIAYIVLYSILPHKELRFIIYVFPLLNMASAAACSYVYIRKSKGPIFELLFWGQIVVVVSNIAMTVALVCVAMTNYPGGQAISKLHKVLRNEPFVHVHIGNLAAQTGVSRFTQLHDHWLYSKNESLELHQLKQYTHLLIEAKSKYSPAIKYFAQTHEVLDIIESFSHVALSYKLMPPVRIKTRPAIFILERKDFRQYPHGHPTEKFENISPDDYELQTNIEETEYVNEMTSKELYGFSRNIEDLEKDQIVMDEEYLVEENSIPTNEETVLYDSVIGDDVVEEVVATPKLVKAKKAIDELKSLRHERKKKAIEKIKSETRKEVVASAKEKLKEIMKRHKHIAEELTENIANDAPNTTGDVDSRGDIPEQIYSENIAIETQEDETIDTLIQINETLNSSNENIDSIVDEVIVRLIDRKIYDDKTKPEDIKAEDRQIIQKIVEEVLTERMNYTKTS